MDYKLDEKIFDDYINDFLPRFLTSKVLFYFIICLFVLKIFSVALFFNIPKNLFFAEISRSALIQETNNERAYLGLGTLKESEKLNQAALMKAQDMVKNQYFAHQSPAGVSPWYWFKVIDYNYKYAGENLAIGFFDSSEVYQAWLASSGHRANLLNPNYKEIGMAVLNGNFDGNNTTVVVQLFGNPKAVAVISPAKKVSPIVSKPKDSLTEATANTAVQEKINKDNSQITVKILGESDNNLNISLPVLNKIDNSLYSKIVNFSLYSQSKILETTAYIFLLIIILIFIFDIYINLDKQNNISRIRVLSYIFILCVITFVDRNILIQIATHNLSV